MGLSSLFKTPAGLRVAATGVDLRCPQSAYHRGYASFGQGGGLRAGAAAGGVETHTRFANARGTPEILKRLLKGG